MIETELAIIGAGVAGLSAAAEAARLGIAVLVIERMGAGGQVMTVERITNFPGYDEISGFELGPLLQEEAEDAGAQFLLDSVLSIQSEPAQGAAAYVVRCEGETVRARAVLIAAGSTRKRMGAAGEEELDGRGVSHCASCDGPLFRGESVCVVGGGDSAFSEALVLGHHAKDVVVVFREEAPHAQPALIEDLAGLPNVRLLPSAEVTRVLAGEKGVRGVRVRGLAGDEEHAVQGVFVYAGLQAATGFLDGLVSLDDTGRIETDATRGTAQPGVFAAGDIRAGTPYLLAACADDGRAAAQSVHRYLREGQAR